MREILFRGRTVSESEYWDDGEWIEGFYTCFNGDEHRIYTGYAETDCGDYYPDWFNVIPETVGRFTGLHDKNGKRIWENDIVKARIYNDVGCYPYTETKIVKVQIPNIYRMSIDGDFEVIGNSIDNPELLTAERSENAQD